MNREREGEENLKITPGGAWVAQSVKHLALDFCSGHDLTVRRFEPRIGLLADSMQLAWVSLSLSLCLRPCPSHAVSLSQHK